MPCCRCGFCRARRTLKHKPEWYARVPQCRNAWCVSKSKRLGRKQRWVVDNYRHRHEHGKRPTCRMNQCLHHFPHRRGSKGCIFHPEYDALMEQKWTEATAGFAPF